MSSGVSHSDFVLVAGATGGVGQLTVSRLLEKQFKVRVLSRSAQKAEQMFKDRVEIVVGDTRLSETLASATQGVDYIICCTGTTAFPSRRWEFEAKYSLLDWIQLYFNGERCQQEAKNSPQKIDAQGVINLVNAAPENLKRFVLVSSCGVLRKENFPFNILNGFGVLDAKQQGEEAVIKSGLPYTIIRPGRLIDGPYTSYDLNSLLKAKTQGKRGIVLGTGDRVFGDTSRIDLATACRECLMNLTTENKVFELVNQGVRPKVINWQQLFSDLE